MGKAKAGSNLEKSWNTGTQSGATGIDPATQAYIDQIRQAAGAAGGAMPAGVTSGYNALTGNADAAKQFMNPYQAQVIDAMNKQFDRSGQMAQLGVNDAATQTGAFGGSRQGVASGVAASQNDLNRNTQVGNLLQSGFTDAMGRATNAVNLGMGGAGSPEAYRLAMLKQGFSGTPYGQTYKGTQGNTNTKVGTNLEAKLGLFPGLFG